MSTVEGNVEERQEMSREENGTQLRAELPAFHRKAYAMQSWLVPVGTTQRHSTVFSSYFSYIAAIIYFLILTAMSF